MPTHPTFSSRAAWLTAWACLTSCLTALPASAGPLLDRLFPSKTPEVSLSTGRRVEPPEPIPLDLSKGFGPIYLRSTVDKCLILAPGYQPIHTLNPATGELAQVPYGAQYQTALPSPDGKLIAVSAVRNEGGEGATGLNFLSEAAGTRLLIVAQLAQPLLL